MPVRIQRQRTKGWRMPPGAVYVGRPTWFGNPWRAGGFVDQLAATSDNELLLPRDMVTWFGRRANEVIADEAEAVEMYRRWLFDCNNRNVPLPVPRLRGKDLACWCPLDRPCHADVLLEMANGPRSAWGMPFVDVTWSIPNAGASFHRATGQCSHRLPELPLHRRAWTCPECGTAHDRDENAARNLEYLVVGPARAEPAGNDARPTRGEMVALAAPQGATKLPSVNRELSTLQADRFSLE